MQLSYEIARKHEDWEAAEEIRDCAWTRFGGEEIGNWGWASKIMLPTILPDLEFNSDFLETNLTIECDFTVDLGQFFWKCSK